MRIALIDSGSGLLSTAAALRRARPDADLVCSMDPDHMPWGPRGVGDIRARAMAVARAAARTRPDAIVVACNTASVHALEVLRAEFEPGTPVIGTVPAVRPAADNGGPVSIWATPATTGSPYQRDLIHRFAQGVEVTPVACYGLADAIEAADHAAIDAAVMRAADRTPKGVLGIVLGCTHYDLVAERISTALGGPVLFTAADAVTAQTLRRLGASPSPGSAATGTITVLASGRPAALPPAALTYPAGRLLAEGAAPDRPRAARPDSRPAE